MNKSEIERIVSELFTDQANDNGEGNVTLADDQNVEHAHQIFENLCLGSSGLFD